MIVKKLTTILFLLSTFFNSEHSYASCHVDENPEYIDSYPPYANYSGLGELKNPFCKKNTNLFFCSNIENGLKLLHNFEYSQGIFNFQIAQKFAPNLAIGYALELFAYNQYTGNSIIFNKELQEKSKQMLEFLKNPNLIIQDEEEKDFINAIKSFFADEDGSYVELKNFDILINQNKIFEQNICSLINKYPENLEIISFCGLSVLRSREGAYDLEKNKRTFEILEKGYQINSKHPGILHYMIHIVENPLQAHYSAKAGELYSEIAYNAVHGIHMPAHHYFNVGNWQKIIEKTKGAWDLGQKMRMNYDVKVGSIDNFHSMRWIIYSYLQLEQYDDAFNAIKKMVESNGDDYLNGGAIFDFSQSVAITLLEGKFTKEQTNYLLEKLNKIENADDKFSKIYLNYVKAFFDYKNNNLKNFNKYIENIDKIIQDSENSHPMSLYNFKIMRVHLDVFQSLTKNDFKMSEEKARHALKIEDEYVKTNFETGLPFALIPSNELLGLTLSKQRKYQEAINEFLKIDLRFPNRAITKKYLEECYIELNKNETLLKK